MTENWEEQLKKWYYGDSRHYEQLIYYIKSTVIPQVTKEFAERVEKLEKELSDYKTREHIQSINRTFSGGDNGVELLKEKL